MHLWASRDADALAGLFTEDGVYHNVPNPPVLEGREAVRAWLAAIFEHLWVEIEVRNLASDGEWVMCERVDTHVVGERRLPLPVMNVSRVVDGRIALWRDYYDYSTAVELGLGSTEDLPAAPPA
jgi:limonene-1,2-epoxide hydrolase